MITSLKVSSAGRYNKLSMSDTSFSTPAAAAAPVLPPLQLLHTLLLMLTPLITMEFCDTGDSGDAMKHSILVLFLL
jgi:hypothetical protein